jgi:hypothetical protein
MDTPGKVSSQIVLEFIKSTDIFDQTAKDDLTAWIKFIFSGPDSTESLRWYHNFHTTLGYYLSMLHEKLNELKFQRERIAALERARISRSVVGGKPTEGRIQSEVNMNADYEKILRVEFHLERMYEFLDSFKSGMSEKVLESYAANQRLEMKQDVI